MFWWRARGVAALADRKRVHRVAHRTSAPLQADAGNQQVPPGLRNRDQCGAARTNFISAGPHRHVSAGQLLKVSVHLGQGTDNLIVDSTEGDVAIPGGIEFDGGTGADTFDFKARPAPPLNPPRKARSRSGR